MPNKGDNITAMLKELAMGCLHVRSTLPRAKAAPIEAQLSRSSTSGGANYAEACGAESRKDFIHKLRVAEKEVRETRYWLDIVHGSGVKDDPRTVDALVRLADRLVGILYVSIRTAERGDRK